MLLIVVHHAVFDGWSAGVLVRDLAALYHAEVTGTPPGLPELAVQFADYALWERGRLAGPALAGLEDYWRQVLAGFPTVPFPASRPRPPHRRLRRRPGHPHHRPRPAGRPARAVPRARAPPCYVTLLAGLLALLHRYTGASDLVVGTVQPAAAAANSPP